MLVVSFDTCWGGCSAAVCRVVGTAQPRVLAHRLERMKTGQAEALPVMLQGVIENAGIDLSEVSRVAVPIGPGSFTGVRITIATARALALVAPVDLVACSSLAVVAANFADGSARLARPLIVAMDARNGQAYVQLFEDIVFGADSQPQILSYGAAAELVAGPNFDIAGTAAEAISNVVDNGGRSQKVRVLDPDPVPDAIHLCQAAGGLPVVDGPLMPLYLRPADAKPQKKPAIARAEHGQ